MASSTDDAQSLVLGVASSTDDAQSLVLGMASSTDDAQSLVLGMASSTDDAQRLVRSRVSSKGPQKLVLGVILSTGAHSLFGVNRVSSAEFCVK